MRYTISSFAKMQGLTVDTVRQYEKKKIIIPYKDKINNYRYYSDYDVRNVSTCKFYSSLGFSLTQASKMIDNMTADGLSLIFAKQAHHVEQKLKFEQAKLSMLNKYIGYFKYIPDKINNYVVVSLPEFVRLPHSANETPVLDDSTTKEVRQWISLLPVTFYTRWVHYDIMSDNSEPFKFEMALATDSKSAAEFGLKLSKNTITTKPSDYIFTVIKKPDMEPTDRFHFKPAMEYLEKRNFVLSGDSFLIYLASDVINGEKFNYHGVFLPFNSI